ncbi:MAG: hypothetical protein II937_04375 [Bacteroidales bacterium]|nr:hypothetical protein [Bacteroidales bacterium]
MKKFFLALVCALTFSGLANAQIATENVVQFDKTSTRPGFSATFSNDVKDVTTAVRNRMAKEAPKKKAVSAGKNLTKYEAVSSNNICLQTCDVYFLIEGNSKSAKVTLFVSKGYENFVSSSNDQETADLAKTFVSSLAKDIETVTLANQIDAQAKIVSKAENEYKKSVSNKEKLQKELQKAEDNVKNSDAERQKQKALLEELRSKAANQ